jgi:ABC-type Fe3+-hydroxamate transport system substrate-binding protein
MRIVSLVPSLTETLAELGLGDALTGVTDYCVHGTPPAAVRIGGTKNPDLPAIAALEPDLVLANAEENRAQDLDALRGMGRRVHVTGPDDVPSVVCMLHELGALLGVAAAASRLAGEIERALEEVEQSPPARRARAIALIWRKPWMAVGERTYAGDLLRRAGFDHVLDGCGARYPNLAGVAAVDPEVLLLPSEPYHFTTADLPAVAERFPAVPAHFVDGRDLTWHGSSTPRGLRAFAGLARRLAGSAQ